MKKLALFFICVIFILVLFSKDVNEVFIDNEIGSYQVQAMDASVLLYGKWKVLCPYTVLPSAFNFNRYESFEKYQSTFDDPLVKEFVEPYNIVLIGKVIEFSDGSFLQDGTEVLHNPEYELTKMDGHIYNDSLFGRYRPFSDFFKDFDMSSYYKFRIKNYNALFEPDYSLKPSGFIVSENYILCPINDEWIFYILERLP